MSGSDSNPVSRRTFLNVSIAAADGAAAFGGLTSEGVAKAAPPRSVAGRSVQACTVPPLDIKSE
jgi:hypothetical protein